MLVQVLFYVFGTLLVACALGLIVARNPVYSALFLVLCFCNAAVMVLFLFVVMMLDINLAELRRGFTRFAWLGWVTGLDVGRGMVSEPESYSNTLALGQVIYTRYAY